MASSELRAICNRTRSTTESKPSYTLLTINRVLVFKEAPELVYSGLTKTLGKAKELEKNLEDPSCFDSDIDINIPVEETQEYQK
jgi:hypothetical protein